MGFGFEICSCFVVFNFLCGNVCLCLYIIHIHLATIRKNMVLEFASAFKIILLCILELHGYWVGGKWKFEENFLC